MKKKLLLTLVGAMMITTLVSGCGKKTDEKKTGEATAESIVEAVDDSFDALDGKEDKKDSKEDKQAKDEDEVATEDVDVDVLYNSYKSQVIDADLKTKSVAASVYMMNYEADPYFSMGYSADYKVAFMEMPAFAMFEFMVDGEYYYFDYAQDKWFKSDVLLTDNFTFDESDSPANLANDDHFDLDKAEITGIVKFAGMDCYEVRVDLDEPDEDGTIGYTYYFNSNFDFVGLGILNSSMSMYVRMDFNEIKLPEGMEDAELGDYEAYTTSLMNNMVDIQPEQQESAEE